MANDCPVNKIDSDITRLAIAEETCLGVLPASPTWQVMEPNTYSDFGGDPTSTARSPISDTRQNEKGALTNLTVSGGFNNDITASNMTNLMQGFFMSDKLVPASSYAQLPAGSFSQTSKQPLYYNVTDTSVDLTAFFSQLGASYYAAIAGVWIYASDGSSAGFFARIKSVGKNFVEFDDWSSDFTKITFPSQPTANFPTVIRNGVSSADIVRRSYTMERSLGVFGENPYSQAEYIEGAVPGQFTLNIPANGKASVDLTFTGCENTFKDGSSVSEQPLSMTGTLVPAPGEAAINTTSDIRLAKIAIKDSYSLGDIGADPLFSFVSESTMTLNNNLSAKNAIGVLGAFDITAGKFEIGGSITAYFATVAAQKAVRNNVTCSYSIIAVSENGAFIVDAPSITLTGARLNVTQGDAIMIPLTPAAFKNDNGYTASFQAFSSLPAYA